MTEQTDTPTLLEIVRARILVYFPNDDLCPCGREYPTRATLKKYTREQIIDGKAMHERSPRRRVSKCCFRFGFLPDPFDFSQHAELKRQEKEDRKLKRLQRGIEKQKAFERFVERKTVRKTH